MNQFLFQLLPHELFCLGTCQGLFLAGRLFHERDDAVPERGQLHLLHLKGRHHPQLEPFGRVKLLVLEGQRDQPGVVSNEGEAR